MKKDIKIPKVKNLQLALVNVFNTDLHTYEWLAYLINKKNQKLELVLVVTNGYDADKKTATMRHKIEELPANSVAKIEYIPDDLLALNNSFKVSFFLDNQIFEKDFLIPKNTVSLESAKELELFKGSKGVVFE